MTASIRFIFLFFFIFWYSTGGAIERTSRSWIHVEAHSRDARDQIAAAGVSIESIGSDFVEGIATGSEIENLQALGFKVRTRPLEQVSQFDFPAQDAAFRNYNEMQADLKKWAEENPNIVSLDSLGKTVEGREIWHLRISTDLKDADAKPGIVFLGGHHAREHISVETPLKLAEKMINGYKNQNAEIVQLLKTRDIHIIPSVNPDGSEYDVSTGLYRYWRKNRATINNVIQGVDLNRNYGFGWGGGGASPDPHSDTFRGPSPFSEPETQGIKKFIEAQQNITILLSFHTFSQLILYPWGHQHESISNERDLKVHKTMAETMAEWNGYTPEQSSDLYIASGDTTDWAYGEHKIISFTFELDPGSMFEGGFYPGADQIDVIAQKNWKPFLYLISYADNPYRVLEPQHARFGLNSPLVQ